MRPLKFIRRWWWRMTLCEPEERAELSCHRPTGDFAANLRYVKRLDRYEETFGPFQPATLVGSRLEVHRPSGTYRWSGNPAIEYPDRESAEKGPPFAVLDNQPDNLTP